MRKEEALHKITETLLLRKENYLEHHGVLGGSSGVLLYLAYYSCLFNGKEANCLIDEIVNLQSKELPFDNIRLGDGISGIVWTYSHINGQFGKIIEADSLFDHYLKELSKNINLLLSSDNIDPLHGLLGIQMALEQLGDEKLSKEIDKLIFEKAQKSENGVYWYESFDPEEKVINTSLAHGQAAFINYLSHRLNKYQGEEGAQVLLLIEQAVAYLESIQLNNMISIYPSIIRNGISSPSRLAWCYGDLSIAISYLFCSIETANHKLFERAIRIANHTTKRRSKEETAVQDLGFCHGSSGLAQLYQYFYRNTDDNRFLRASNYWMKFTIDRLFKKELTYKAFDSTNGWRESYGLLNGLAGIGLTIISSVEPSLSSWEQLFNLKPIINEKARNHAGCCN